MNCKMLSEEHRIVAVPMKYEGGLHIIYNHSKDAILIKIVRIWKRLQRLWKSI